MDYRELTREFFAALFIGAGVLHFAAPSFWVPLVPTYLLAPKFLVLVSGFFEILGGVGLLIPQLRTAAGWGLVALLIAVFPAHVHVWRNDVPFAGIVLPWWGHALRMPLQAVFIAGVIWSAELLTPKK
jgi:uncharacterized membrane protein